MLIQNDQLEANSNVATTKAGITISEMSEPHIIAKDYGLASSYIGRAESVMNEPAMSVEKLTGRMTFVGTSLWDTTMDTGDIIAQYSIPQDLLVNLAVTEPFNLFQYWRPQGNIAFNVRVQVNGNKFTCGNLIAVFIPYASPSQCEPMLSDIINLTTLQHQIIPAATSGIVELAIPFTNPNSWFQLQGDIPIGTLTVMVYNKLQTSTDFVPVLEALTWMSAINPIFKVPRITSPKTFIQYKSKQQYKENNLTIKEEIEDDICILGKTDVLEILKDKLKHNPALYNTVRREVELVKPQIKDNISTKIDSSRGNASTVNIKSDTAKTFSPNVTELNKVITKHAIDQSTFPELPISEKGTIPMAQSRAKTYDGGKVPHFGDPVTNLKPLLTRYTHYQRAFYETVTLTANQINGVAPVIFQSDPVVDICGLPNDYGGTGLISHYAAMYRFGRGSLRYKSNFYVKDKNLGSPFTITRIEVAVLPTCVPVGGLGDNYFEPYFATSGATTGVPSSPPLASVQNNNTLEFEIPYLSQYNVWVNPIYPSLDATEYTRESRMQQIVYAVYIQPFSGYTGTTAAFWWDQFLALGDDFRFGVYTGKPVAKYSALGVNHDIANSFWIPFTDTNFKIKIPKNLNKPDKEIVSVKPQIFEELGRDLGGELDNIISEVLPKEIVTDIVGFIGSMDKPNDSNNPGVIVIKPEQYLAHSTNIEHIPRLSLKPSSQSLCDPEHFATNADEMSMDFLLKKRYSRPFVREWSTTQAKGTILLQYPIGPMMLPYIQSTIGIADGTTFNATLLDYIAKPFSYYRGGMVMVVDVICTMFHTGRLYLGYYPNLSTDEVQTIATDAAATSTYGVQIDLKDGLGRARVVFPYLAPTPVKPIYNGLKNGDFVSQCFLGFFQLRVLNKLVVQTGYSPVVDINIYTCAADDFELYAPNMTNGQIVRTLTPIT